MDARLGGDGGRRERVVPGDHDRLDAHLPQLAEPLPDAPLHDVLQLDDPDHAGAVGDHERGRALLGDPVDRGAHLGGETNLAARFPMP